MITITDSTAIRYVDFNFENNTLRVAFVGGDAYDYFNVPVDVYETLIGPLPSRGAWFNRNVYDRYESDLVFSLIP